MWEMLPHDGSLASLQSSWHVRRPNIHTIGGPQPPNDIGGDLYIPYTRIVAIVVVRGQPIANETNKVAGLTVVNKARLGTLGV